VTERLLIDAATTALLFFDTLKGALDPEDREQRQAVRASGFLDRLERIERACRAAGMPIFYSVPEHRRDGRDWGVTVVGDPPRPTTYQGINYKGSRHAEIVDDVAPRNGDYVIAKHRWSAFHQTPLELSLRTAGIHTIILAGGATEIGIASTAYAARDHDYSLVILRDGCRSDVPGLNDYLMDNVFPRLSRVLTIEAAIALIAASDAPG
jgi:nicotinamidase-related amidase